jgi:hypothetical protein
MLKIIHQALIIISSKIIHQAISINKEKLVRKERAVE